MSSQSNHAGSPAMKTTSGEKNRKVKMKCQISGSNTICDRCIRKSFHCIFEKHRRGRKPTLRPGQTSLHNATEVRARNDAVESGITSPGLVEENTNGHVGSSSQAPQDRPHSDFWVLLEGFRPSGLLNKQAMTGKLSLENITHGQNNADTALRRDETQQIPAKDPVRLSIVNSTIAASLFASFMRELNPYICQFDPSLHTFNYVQRRSPFLLTAILSASAKAFNPSVHQNLRLHAEDLFASCFRSGKKSTEIIQAILVLTYWKEPDDARAWLSIGYVIRMCMELGWHKITPKSPKEYEKMTELQRRESRSIERTWLLLFVYDRNLSLQTGSPSMIPRNELIESAHTWYDDPLSTSQDGMLCALVTLRMIGSEMFDLLNPHRSSYRSTLLDRTDGFMKVLLNDVHKWHRRWSTLPGIAENDLFKFFVGFYGTNLRLLFSLFPLHANLTSGLPEEMIDKQSLLVSYSSAVEMLEMVVQPNISPLIYFVQDSIHIMCAWASIFLIKLLLSVPQSVRSEIEGPAIDAVRRAADMFTSHEAPPNSGCDLQAKFLQNVLRVFKKAQDNRTARPDLPTLINEQQHAQNGSGGMANVAEEMNTQSNLPEQSYPFQDNSQDGSMDNYDYSFGLQDFAFADDDLWSNLFADAGFNINDGTFLAFGNPDAGSRGTPT